jgi:Family of unknown function (DUF6011)
MTGPGPALPFQRGTVTVNLSDSAPVHRCLRPGCGRKLTSPESIARGYGRRCAAKIRHATEAADLSEWTGRQLDDARELIEDGGVVPTSRPDVFRTVSSDGLEVHLTHPKGCNCPAGLRSVRCYHRAAVALVLAA